MRRWIEDQLEAIRYAIASYRDERENQRQRRATFRKWWACATTCGHDWRQENAAGQRPGLWLWRCQRCGTFEWGADAPSARHRRAAE